MVVGFFFFHNKRQTVEYFSVLSCVNIKSMASLSRYLKNVGNGLVPHRSANGRYVINAYRGNDQYRQKRKTQSFKLLRSVHNRSLLYFIACLVTNKYCGRNELTGALFRGFCAA